MQKIKYWIYATRPKTLIASISPVCITSALSYRYYHFQWYIFILILVAALLIQIMANFINDLYDYKKGSDREDRKGPDRMIQKGHISENKMKNGIWFVMILATIVGSFLVYIGGLIILFIGLSAFLFSYLYTATKLSIAYNGLGEFFVFIYFGIIASLGTFYLQTGTYGFEAMLIGVIIGCINANLLVINNIRDYIEDYKSNKKTLVVVFGENFGKIEFFFLILFSYLSLYYLLHSIDKIHLMFLFSPAIIFIILIQFNIWFNKKFIIHFALPQLSLYIVVFSITLVGIILI